MKNKIFTTKFIAGVGILTAIEIVLYIAGSFIVIGGVNINLALVPIAFGAIMYGPLCGLFLGLVNGCAVLLTPATQAFISVSAIGTVLVCLLKCSLAGLASGLIYKLINNRNDIVATVIASIVVPIINTVIFITGCLIFFDGAFQDLILLLVSTSFLIELGSTAALTPGIIRVLKVVNAKEENVEQVETPEVEDEEK